LLPELQRLGGTGCGSTWSQVSVCKAGDDVPRKGRARRFREARELKQGFDDGLFREGSGTLADVDLDADAEDDDEWDEEDDWEDDPLDDDPLKEDERRAI
jgi:hypothetical protein